jgi:hypothetical protein
MHIDNPEITEKNLRDKLMLVALQILWNFRTVTVCFCINIANVGMQTFYTVNKSQIRKFLGCAIRQISNMQCEPRIRKLRCWSLLIASPQTATFAEGPQIWPILSILYVCKFYGIAELICIFVLCTLFFLYIFWGIFFFFVCLYIVTIVIVSVHLISMNRDVSKQ